MAIELFVPFPKADQQTLDQAQREATEALHTADMHGSVLFKGEGLRIVVLSETTEERIKGLLSNSSSFSALFAADGSERRDDELLLGEAEEEDVRHEPAPVAPPTLPVEA